MRARSFARVNSACQKDYFFVHKSIAVITLRKNVRVGSFFIFFLNTVLRAYRNDFDFSAFQTVTKHISVEIDVRLVE
jgi:hypothetical protein